ncbi:MAG: PEGA domain-containing protein [Patescibacteria group bacterium]
MELSSCQIDEDFRWWYNTDKAMPKVRILVFLSTILVVALLGLVASFYARGYKFDTKTFKFTPNGILVVNSEPNGSQIYIDGVLKTATSATISLAPGTYNIEIKKNGFLTWSKTMVIKKEVVTEIDASLFPAAPSLSAVTFSGVLNPVSAADSTRVAYAVASTEKDIDKEGLWVSEIVTLPIGFSREPKRITDGDLSAATWKWSPDAKEILLTQATLKKLDSPTDKFLLDVSEFKSKSELKAQTVLELAQIEKRWAELEQKQLDAQLSNLPNELGDILTTKATDIVFSPDENKILYTATDSASIPEGIVKELPGASSQKQARDIGKGKKYVYDTKEDRNFEVATKDEITYWLPTSKHLILPQKDKLIIEEYDGTNKQIVYSGSYIYPHAYPYTNSAKLLILTNLGSTDSLSNLYTLNLK